MGSRWQELGGAASPCPSVESAGPPAPLQKRWPGLAATPQRAGGDRFPCPDPRGAARLRVRQEAAGSSPPAAQSGPRGPPAPGKPAPPARSQGSLLRRLLWRKPESREEGTPRGGRERGRERQSDTDRQTEPPEDPSGRGRPALAVTEVVRHKQPGRSFPNP